MPEALEVCILAGESSSDTPCGCPVCLHEAAHGTPARGVATAFCITLKDVDPSLVSQGGGKPLPCYEAVLLFSSPV